MDALAALIEAVARAFAIYVAVCFVVSLLGAGMLWFLLWLFIRKHRA